MIVAGISVPDTHRPCVECFFFLDDLQSISMCAHTRPTFVSSVCEGQPNKPLSESNPGVSMILIEPIFVVDEVRCSVKKVWIL